MLDNVLAGSNSWNRIPYFVKYYGGVRVPLNLIESEIYLVSNINHGKHKSDCKSHPMLYIAVVEYRNRSLAAILEYGA